jgi:hypothetical protein
MAKYKYIGEGVCTNLDHEGTKQGAFFTIRKKDIEEGLKEIDSEEFEIIAVPNKNGSLSVKIKIS